MRFLEKSFRSLSSYVLPTECIACGLFQKHAMCKQCLEVLKTDGLLNYECCTRCGVTLQHPEIQRRLCIQCTINPPTYEATICLDRYNGVLQTGLHQLKYQKRTAFAHGLAHAWNQILAEQLKDQSADYLLPVPLSPEKLVARGFNQSWELARRIHCAPNIQKSPYILRRHHYSEHQAGGTRVDRQISIRGMFYIEPAYIELLESKTVIMFDDVMTSGATLNEIGRVLKDNGVLRIINWVLLRTSRST